ncbi:MAG TPA: hypothetical protein VGJ16_09010 [Pirellulales bacterium]|jgi:hypothetical protein
MAKKKAAPKSKPSKAKPKKAEEVSQLIISQDVWDRYVKGMGDAERSKRTRDLFNMAPGEDTVYGVSRCRIVVRKGKTTAKSDDDSNDEGFFPIKLCEEGA